VSFDVWHSRANRESDDDFGDLKIVTKDLIAGLLSELEGQLCPGFNKSDELMGV
jgi:hypothetical protein